MAGKKHKISGTVHHQKLEMGFWGIEGDDGENWRPVKMPADLQEEGQKITAEVEEVDEEASFMMWGTPVKILSFEKK